MHRLRVSKSHALSAQKPDLFIFYRFVSYELLRLIALHGYEAWMNGWTGPYIFKVAYLVNSFISLTQNKCHYNGTRRSCLYYDFIWPCTCLIGRLLQALLRYLSCIDILPFHMFLDTAIWIMLIMEMTAKSILLLQVMCQDSLCSVSKHCQSTNAYGSNPFSS